MSVNLRPPVCLLHIKLPDRFVGSVKTYDLNVALSNTKKKSLYKTVFTGLKRLHILRAATNLNRRIMDYRLSTNSAGDILCVCLCPDTACVINALSTLETTSYLGTKAA